MVGGAISGYNSIGRLKKPRTPRITRMIEITEDRIGLSINLLNMILRI
jgi:hypothetical protein